MASSTRFALVLSLIISFSGMKTQAATSASSIDSLLTGYNNAEHDTTRISLLFSMGNLFLEGPSDSLIHYYQKALHIIEDFYKQPEEVLKRADEKVIAAFQHFHFRALNEIGIEKFFQGQYTESLEYAHKALNIAESMGDKGLISECCGAIGIVYKNQGKYLEAMPYYEKALQMAIELKDTAWIAGCYTNAGNVYRRIGNYRKALEYHLKALDVFEKTHEKRRIAIGLMNIGNIYEDQKDYNLALEYHSRSLQLSYETNDFKRIAECLINIGNIYSNRGNYTLAREYYENSLKIHIEQGFGHTLCDCYKYIGLTYEKEGELIKSVEFYNKSLVLAKKEEDMSNLSEILGYLSNVFIRQKEFRKGFEYAKNSLDIALNNRDLQNIKNAYLYLSEAEKGMDNTASALSYFKQYSAIKDSLFSNDKYRAIKEIEAKYELEKKEQQVALLTEKNHVQMLTLSRRTRLIFTSMGIILLLVLIGYILIRISRLKAKHHSVELEQKLLRSQMNPHFIFNSLMAIQSYIYKNDPVQAGDFLAKFADLIRMTLENSRVEFVLLENEIKMLNIYLELQALRFNDKFGHSIEIESGIDPAVVKVPPMLAQPFIENAIEHGLRYKTEGGCIAINYYMNGENLLFTVEDNGIGREKARELAMNKKYKAMATSITRERLELLSKRSRKNYQLELIDLKDEKQLPTGTLVKFSLPYQIVD